MAEEGVELQTLPQTEPTQPCYQIINPGHSPAIAQTGWSRRLKIIVGAIIVILILFVIYLIWVFFFVERTRSKLDNLEEPINSLAQNLEKTSTAIDQAVPSIQSTATDIGNLATSVQNTLVPNINNRLIPAAENTLTAVTRLADTAETELVPNLDRAATDIETLISRFEEAVCSSTLFVENLPSFCFLPLDGAAGSVGPVSPVGSVDPVTGATTQNFTSGTINNLTTSANQTFGTIGPVSGLSSNEFVSGTQPGCGIIGDQYGSDHNSFVSNSPHCSSRSSHSTRSHHSRNNSFVLNDSDGYSDSSCRRKHRSSKCGRKVRFSRI